MLIEQEKLYDENLKASVAILKKLSVEWKQHAPKHISLEPLRAALIQFKLKVHVFMFVIFHLFDMNTMFVVNVCIGVATANCYFALF